MKLPVQRADFEAAETPVLKRPDTERWYYTGKKAPRRFQFQIALCREWAKEHFHVKDGAAISLVVSPEPSDDAWSMSIRHGDGWSHMRWRRTDRRTIWPMFTAVSDWLVETTGIKPDHQMRIYVSLFVHEE